MDCEQLPRRLVKLREGRSADVYVALSRSGSRGNGTCPARHSLSLSSPPRRQWALLSSSHRDGLRPEAVSPNKPFFPERFLSDSVIVTKRRKEPKLQSPQCWEDSPVPEWRPRMLTGGSAARLITEKNPLRAVRWNCSNRRDGKCLCSLAHWFCHIGSFPRANDLASAPGFWMHLFSPWLLESSSQSISHYLRTGESLPLMPHQLAHLPPVSTQHAGNDHVPHWARQKKDRPNKWEKKRIYNPISQK